MARKDLASIYNLLSPVGSRTAESREETKQKTIEQLFMKFFLDPTGKFYSFDEISAQLSDYFQKNKSDESARESSKNLYHVIGRDVVDFGDEGYWGKVKSTTDIVKSLSANKSFSLTAVATRSLLFSPSVSGTGAVVGNTESVEFFLNYLPPVVASMMVPYLEVEFQSEKIGDVATVNTLNTPSTLRFLLGSVDAASLTNADRSLASQKSTELKDNKYKKTATTGVEMFLCPQTLTNMDSLMPKSGERLERVRPFIPFASIEDFTVDVKNAGAGKFGSQRATLKFKIHDKSRISEFSEFIKTGGYNKSLVWTTYGWSVPQKLGEENEYARLINQKLKVRQCWKVVNPQFNFDATGQVILSIELANAASSVLKKLNVASGSNFSASMERLNETIEKISEFRSKYDTSKRFSVSVLADQLLNAASTAGTFTDFKGDVKKTIDNIYNSLKGSDVPIQELEELKSNLASLQKGGVNYDIVNAAPNAAARKKFDSLADGEDPFLPTKEKQDYFGGELPDLVASYKSTSEARNAVIAKKAKSGKTQITPRVDVVSFGKMFLNFVAPGIASSNDCDELQVFFYTLNDSCGPSSGHSIAEFPINVTSLAYAYAEELRNSSSDLLSVEAFLGLVMETQFSDVRAIGFGMNKAYLPFDPDKPNEAVMAPNDVSDSVVTAWMKKYGSLKTPIIEMRVEYGEPSKSYTSVNQQTSDSTKRIIRIHVYDKNATPFAAAQKIIDSGDGKSIGYVNSNRVKEKLRTYSNDFNVEFLQNLKKDIDDEKKRSEALKSSGLDKLVVDEFSVTIPKDRVSFKNQLMKNVPTITIGANGSMVLAVNVASKTDGTMGAINMIDSMKGTSSKASLAPSGLEELNGLPMRVVPVQVTMTTMGMPIAQLYQTYFLDFETGTSIDNLYTCVGVNHSFSQGKFATSLTFMYSNGYGRFTAPQSFSAMLSGEMSSIIDDVLESEKKVKKKK